MENRLTSRDQCDASRIVLVQRTIETRQARVGILLGWGLDVDGPRLPSRARQPLADKPEMRRITGITAISLS